MDSNVDSGTNLPADSSAKEPTRAKPLLVYDGDCSFCKYWLGYWKSLIGNAIDYKPFQEAASEFPGIPLESFRSAAQFIDIDGSVSSGAEAMLRSLSRAPGCHRPLWCYQHLSLFRRVSDASYRFVARHRGPLHSLSRLFWGERVERAQYLLTRSLALRLLGLVYLIAFVSWLPQVRGLIGSEGILPATALLQSARTELGSRAYFALPTLAWLSSTDRALQLLTSAGIAVSLPIIAGIAVGPCLLLAWVLYLSQVSIGQDFMAFQWDILLLEAGFLAIFIAPWRSFRMRALAPAAGSDSSAAIPAPSPAIVWLFRWLVFRVFFLSGIVKLQSGDSSWRNLTAMSFHYLTQPLPNAIAWYMYQLPLWFQKLSTAIVLGWELFVPLLVFAPRRLRHWGASLLILLQILILLTGNYTFFNLLTIVLCIFLFDDRTLLNDLPRALRAKFAKRIDGTIPVPRPLWRKVGVGILAALLVTMSLIDIGERFDVDIPRTVASPFAPLAPFYVTGTYGLFAVMTTTRPEIVIEGSNDTKIWREYDFRYKPGDLRRAPGWVAPHQPRLDWQMWFAALGNYRANRWFVNFAVRLLQGSPAVLKLIKDTPFPGHPPRYIRAELYNYRFTSAAEKKATGNWWVREYVGHYLPPIALRGK